MYNRISNEKKKTVPVRKEQLMKRKPLIELGENVSTDMSITFVNDKTINNKSYYDIVYDRLLNVNNGKLKLSETECNTININNIKLYECQELLQFSKELQDLVYSCISNHFVNIINSILKYDIGIEVFVKDLGLNSGEFDPNISDDSSNYDFMYYKYRVAIKTTTCIGIYNRLCDALRNFVYNTPLNLFDLDGIGDKIEVTHDNIYITLHNILLQDCMSRIECGVDIICTKFMHYRMNFNPDQFTIPIKFIEEK